MEDYKKLFNLNSNQFSEKKKDDRKVDENLYSPEPEQSVDKKVYKSVIRFIPFYADPDKSKFQKDICIMKNSISNERLIIEDPSAFGQFSLTLKYDIILKKLAKDDANLVNELRQNFSRFSKFFSLVQIVKDPNRPDLEGKIKVFNFGFNINKLIETEINPATDGLLDTVSVNPYDLLKGKDFLLVVSKKGKYNNYDGSKFINELTPFKFNGNPTEMSEKGMKDVFSYLKDNSPNLMEYYPKQLEEGMDQKTREFLESIIPYQKIKDEVFSSSFKKGNDNLAAVPSESKKEVVTATELGNSIKKENESLSEKTKTKKEKEPVVEADEPSENSYKDLLDSL